ncbi:hypothetical protein CBD41_00640 [bacterium TMED181]|nr:hypothetical protein [Planctomycetota bacterium]OUW47578.1 MAG: hypothetical protein CBD41_00640 [bacterium TMED181]
MTFLFIKTGQGGGVYHEENPAGEAERKKSPESATCADSLLSGVPSEMLELFPKEGESIW